MASARSVQGATGDKIAHCLESVSALYIADSLSRLRSSLPTYLVMSLGKDGLPNVTTLGSAKTPGDFADMTDDKLGLLHDPTKYVRIHLPMSRYGYEYGFRGVTIYIATSILLLHVLLCLFNIRSILSRGRSSDAWTSMSEMLVLAINSPPAEQLRNTCTGVSKLRTWVKLVYVSETLEDHLGIVLDDPDGDTEAVAVMDSRPRTGRSTADLRAPG